jgi:hypothetical protein
MMISPESMLMGCPTRSGKRERVHIVLIGRESFPIVMRVVLSLWHGINGNCPKENEERVGVAL